ncbi:TPA: phosphoserine phosphatase [Haemophilus influenzae]|uniref:Phosphoserine phosphatase n=5 Tax=Haemophilus influenzae TaxID=727 RepID=A0A0H3PF17_HAEI3|nr:MULTISPECIES: phosphoserine phosphatase [Haemophilus]ABQ98714.1 phosphoserine phosphatase [Haemophilus influenzae PittEE]AAX88049.1 phosphoserine phosphatase [Haemophilus influenzae 86-028NP]ADO96689.1 Phosphoserine phosphatase [Haemophilus influenzae R2846]AIT68302.1 phosphoserine phosphatase [Haemophilus influenzae]AJO90434.1 Phosphoserine phosphatase [Haemophilus influenzae]
MQIQCFESITQKYPQFPTALLANEEPIQNGEPFILYGTKLDITKLEKFQQKCGQNFQIFDVWMVAKNIIVLLKGQWFSDFIKFAHDVEVDIAKLDFSPKLSQAGLLVMDMDSTAIQIECIDEIAKLAGVGELVSAITESAMRGELDFEQSLRCRVGTLKGAPESILQQVRENLPLMSGLVETIQTLQKYGWKTAIASGGFTYFADYLKALLQLDFAASNQFDIEDGKLTGLVKGDVVDAQYKAKTLQHLLEEYGIYSQHSIAIGDGANDLAMMNVAGLGVAFHAKPKVQQQAQIVVNFADLTALLCLLSANDRI